MVRISLRLIVVALVAILGCSVIIGGIAAQTPITSQLAGVPLSDATLDLRTSQMPVADFLRSVSSKATLNSATPVKLSADNDAAIERISVFTKQMPVQDVLANVATLYGWDWSSDNKDVLTLGPSTKRKRWEQRRSDAMVSNAFVPVLEKLRAEVETRAARERGAKAAFQAAKDPEQTNLREREYRWLKAETAASRFCATLTRLQKQQLLEQEQVDVPWSQLTPLQRDLSIAVVMPYQFGRSNFSDSGKGWDEAPTKEERERYANELVSRLTRTGVTLSITLEPVTGVVLGLRVAGHTSVPDTAGLGKFEETLPPVRGNPYIIPDEEQKGVSGAPTSVVRDGIYTELENTPFPDKLNVVPGDSWSDVVAKLAERIDKPIFSDGYIAARGIRPTRRLGLDGGTIRPLAPPADELLTRSGSLASGLDLLCRTYNMVWWQQNGALFFRSRTWLVERRYEVPVPIRKILLTEIRNLSREYGGPTPIATALLQTLSGLRLHQLQGLSATGKPGEEIEFFISKGERLNNSVISLRFFGFFNSLTAAQQQAVLSTSGLTMGAMEEDQQSALANIVGPKGLRAAASKRLLFSVEVFRLPDLRRERFEGQASAASIKFHFTNEVEAVAPYFFAVAVAEERPQSTEQPEGNP